MAWATTTEVGCAWRLNCPVYRGDKLYRHTFLLVCNYNPIFYYRPYKAKKATLAKDDLISCITFANGWNHMQGMNGLRLKNNGVTITSRGCLHGKCGSFSRGATLEIPFFNNRLTYRSFSVSFFFRSKTGRDGFLSNSCQPMSILWLWDGWKDIDKWHHFVLSWDGSEAFVYIDKVPTKHFYFQGWDHVQGTKGIYVKNNGVQLVSGDCVHNNCGYFDGQSFLSMPFFKGNLPEHGFSVSFFFKGLINDPSGPSAVSYNAWHHYALSWDGRTVSVYIDSVLTGQRPMLSGHLNRIICAMHIGLGAAELNKLSFYRGRMDEVCFLKGALSGDDVQKININPPYINLL
ncbi:hypothetical protein NP493_1914g00021 [Ridgeia piscesae]|uniref:Uncharacterized protein n=1 Tax=Ridgeia piscesae TaxID=27915 RepID=A0AAD9JPX2_RIDPI|nr:hypothetical protein NP493_1914g00021 [Ridgeia piscesae]